MSLKNYFLQQWHFINAIHYQEILNFEKANLDRYGVVKFREEMLAYHTEQYCKYQGNAPLIELGFVPVTVQFEYPIQTN